MPLRLAVCDMVGTTVAAGDEVPAAFRAAFAEVGVDLSDDDVRDVRGRSKREGIAALIDRRLPGLDDPDATARAVHAHFVELLGSRYEAESRPVPGALATLRRLKERGARVVLTTGLDRRTSERVSRRLGWEWAGLDGVLTGDDVRRGRPAPDLIHAAMALVGERSPESVVVVGDTTSDLEAAASARVRWNVGVLSGAHTHAQLAACPHSAILDDVTRLPDWLEEVGAWI
jgi:phosphonatase-like hydrolase